MANVAQILADVELRQLYNSINNKQRIIFGLQKEGNFALFALDSLIEVSLTLPNLVLLVLNWHMERK